jgi:CheY-like chemotaxis protein
VATILIIESDPSVAALFAVVVESLGATPVFEPDPSGAVPDVLVIDPLVEGASEVATALRAASPDLPIVLVSSRTPAADLRRRLEPTVFLAKPFAVAELSTTLATLLEQR